MAGVSKSGKSTKCDAMREADVLVDNLFRREAGKIAVWLARLLGPSRIDLIEDALQDAFGAALARWPFDGVPNAPAAWLAVAARNKALDRLRQERRHGPIDEAAAWRLGFADPEATGHIDDTIALMFVACHPALSAHEQIILTLKTVCGFGVGEIARGFLAKPEAIAQRLVRAKRKIRRLNLTFSIPEGADLAVRLPGLIQSIYLLFNGGYTSASGTQLMRADYCTEALRLAQLLTEHPLTATGESHALAALICFHQARSASRADAAGRLIPLAEQDRRAWDQHRIGEGCAHLKLAMRADRLSAMHLEAAIAGAHATAPTFEATDWAMVARHYAMLVELKPTAVVRLNAAIAVAQSQGPAEGLARLDALRGSPALRRYPFYYAARGDCLRKLGRLEEAQSAYTTALAQPMMNEAERRHIASKRRGIGGEPIVSADV
jgi:RNA polymerase sigma-70 factor (ECF subfamily)